MERQIDLLADEELEDLHLQGFRIIQSTSTFRFGIDAVLLSDFAGVRKGDRVVDLGTGNGIIPLLLVGKGEPALVHGLEIQPQLVDMARRSVAINRLEGQIEVFAGDLCQPPDQLVNGWYDLVTANPPYMKPVGKLNLEPAVAVARHELKCTLEDVVRTGARLLRHRGRLAIIHRPGRLVELLVAMGSVGVEPKILRLVHPRVAAKPTMAMVMGVKGGRPDLQVLPPLVVYDEQGHYSREILQIYGKE